MVHERIVTVLEGVNTFINKHQAFENVKWIAAFVFYCLDNGLQETFKF